MARSAFSAKHLQISKTNSFITTTLVIASFITIASIVGTRALLGQRSYQARVIKEKELAVKTLDENIKAVEVLVNSYKEFTSRPDNIISGTSTGTSDRDGDNAKIILDALPSKYDFPAIASSLEKILTQKNLQINGITGTDDELAQASKASTVPEVVEIPFSFSVAGSYNGMYDLIDTLEKSIRPIQITSFSISASGGDVQLDISAKTFYQSEKVLTITTKEVQ